MPDWIVAAAIHAARQAHKMRFVFMKLKRNFPTH